MAGGVAANSQGLGAMPAQGSNPSAPSFGGVANDTTMGDTFKSAAPMSNQTFGQRMAAFAPGAFGMSAGQPPAATAQNTYTPPQMTPQFQQQMAPQLSPQAALQFNQMSDMLRGNPNPGGMVIRDPGYGAPSPMPAQATPSPMGGIATLPVQQAPVAPPSELDMSNARQQARAALTSRRAGMTAPRPPVRSTPIR